MDKMLEIHQKHYQGKDFQLHVGEMEYGLPSLEEYFVDRYLDRFSPTLEIGTGPGRIAFALEKEKGFNNIVAIDFVKEFIRVAIMRELAIGSKVEFKIGNAVELPFEDESFSQVIGYGVLISHLPGRDDRIKAFSEIYRVLKPDGIMLINSLNFDRFIHRWVLKKIMKVIRFVYNPYNYEENSLPRIGVGGKFDPLFFRKDKPCVYHYYAGEFIFDVLAAGFYIVDFLSNMVGIIDKKKEQASIHSRTSFLWVAAKKPGV